MTKAEFLTDWPDYVFIVRYWKVSDEMVRLRFALVFLRQYNLTSQHFSRFVNPVDTLGTPLTWPTPSAHYNRSYKGVITPVPTREELEPRWS